MVQDLVGPINFKSKQIIYIGSSTSGKIDIEMVWMKKSHIVAHVLSL